MQQTTKEKLQQIKFEVKAMVSDHMHLQQALEQAQKDLLELRDKLLVEKNKAQELAERNKIAKLADALIIDVVDKQALEKKLQTYIHNIDACIRLLSER
jgi:hypothetical protein